MSDQFDLAELIEGMSKQDAMEYVSSMLNPQTRAAFLAERKSNKLQEAYQAEMGKLDTSNMNPHQRAKSVERIKSKYRAAGLEVW